MHGSPTICCNRPKTMTQHLALYGFIRRKDNLRIQPDGVDFRRCFLFYVGGKSAAVVSLANPQKMTPNLTNMVRHDEAIESVFDRQVILPVRYPMVMTIPALKRYLVTMDRELTSVLQKLVFKSEFHIKIYLSNFDKQDDVAYYYNAFSKYILEHSSQYRYKHFFPTLTREAKEAEFVNYAELVISQISRKLCQHARYWRIKSFCSERLLSDAYFWVRKHQHDRFVEKSNFLKKHFPNLSISVLGPHPPYNFANLNLKNVL
jgi:hypothetical protein